MAKSSTHPTATTLSFREAFYVWLRIGMSSFGGPAGQIAMMPAYWLRKKNGSVKAGS